MPQSDPEKFAKIEHELLVKVTEHYQSDSRVMNVESVTVHPGPQKWKTVSLLTFGDPTTGEIKGHEFRAQTWTAKSGALGYDFDKTEHHWHCEGAHEIEAIRMLLQNEFPEAGKFKIIPTDGEVAALLEQLGAGEITPADAVALVELGASNPDLVAALAASPKGVLVAEAVELERRRQQLEQLRVVVNGPTSSERDDIHPLIKQMAWIFGGEFVGEGRRKALTVGDVLDVPLLRPDGSLHVVELKGANIPRLIEQYRGAKDRDVGTGDVENVPLVVGTDANRAMGQAMGYLTHLDEQRDSILTRFKIDTRRASATVLIGHPDFVEGFNRAEVDETVRIFNSHHTRIELRHYADLIETAERALALSSEDALSDDGEDSAPEPPTFDEWGPPGAPRWPEEFF